MPEFNGLNKEEGGVVYFPSVPNSLREASSGAMLSDFSQVLMSLGYNMASEAPDITSAFNIGDKRDVEVQPQHCVFFCLEEQDSSRVPGVFRGILCVP